MPSIESMISISGVSKLFGSVRAVDNVTLDIAQNEFFAIQIGRASWRERV